MNHQSLSSFIWSVADLLRGDYKQSEYGKVILPFTVLRRLDCVLEPTKAAVLREQTAREKQGLNAEPFLLRKAAQSFYNTSPLDMKKLMGDQDHISQNLFAYIQAFSPAVRDIFERFEFYSQIDRLAKSGLLYLVTEKFAQIDLHPVKITNSQMGLVFEELIRKFAEISNETAGEHFTPREVIRLMVNLLFIEDDDVLANPGVVRTIYDPTAGTGGMLSVAGEYLTEHNPQARLTMFGQELNPESYASARPTCLSKGRTWPTSPSATPSLKTATRTKNSTTCSPIHPSAWSGRRLKKRSARSTKPRASTDASAPASRACPMARCSSCSTCSAKCAPQSTEAAASASSSTARRCSPAARG